MPQPASLLPAVQKALTGLHYGHVQIVVHDGKVVRIERVEKIHLPPETQQTSEPTGHSGGYKTSPADPLLPSGKLQ